MDKQGSFEGQQSPCDNPIIFVISIWLSGS